MKQTVVKLSALCLIGIGVYANAQSIEAVGVNTEKPKETLDVNGTVKVQNLPDNGTGKKFDGEQTTNTTFNATKTVVADADGVLGTVGFVIPNGDEKNNSLHWNPTTNQWEAKPSNSPTLNITNVTDGSSKAEDGFLTFKDGSSTTPITYDLKQISPWKFGGTTRGASGKYDQMWHDGNIGIGNFSNAKYASPKIEARLWIEGGSTSQLRLSQSLNDDAVTWDISTETGGLTFTNRTKNNHPDSRTVFFRNDGSVTFAKKVQGNSSLYGESGKGFYFDAENGKVGIAIGTAPTESIDVKGTAKLRKMPDAGAEDSPVYVSTDGVLKRGSGANNGGGSSPWFKSDDTPATKADIGGKIFHKGTVGIGGDFVSDYNNLNVSDADKDQVKLSVKGAVLAGSYKGANGAEIFPDYVFQKYYTGTSSIKSNYNFSTLTQVENFIKEKGHLPGYLSASEIKKQGYIDLMDTQITNIEKIEELYLHSIEQDKKLKEQAKEIKELKELIKKLVK